MEVSPCKKNDIPWKNNDVNDLLFSENDVREQLCFMQVTSLQSKHTVSAATPMFQIAAFEISCVFFVTLSYPSNRREKFKFLFYHFATLFSRQVDQI